MSVQRRTCLVVMSLLCGFGAGMVHAGEDTRPAQSRTAHQAIDKAISFLVEDSIRWREDRGCATCHHGTMTVWALSEARNQGYSVSAEALASQTAWTKALFVPRIRLPRDSRPGWDLVNTAGIYLGVMSRNLPVLSRDEINALALHLARHQETDGAWKLPPPANGAPPIWESRETIARLALLAWENSIPANEAEAAFLKAGHDKALAWLAANGSGDSTQTLALRLLGDVQSIRPEPEIAATVDRLLKKQNADGGWSQVENAPSDSFATGQALYALSFGKVPQDRNEIQRAVTFLTTTQRDDGSWPMTSRNHPGVTSTRNPIRNPVPITYFGGAWGTLGLVRSVPSSVDSPVRQQQALDLIRGFNGKTAINEQEPDRPVVEVDLGYYDLDDQEFERIARLLTAFSDLTQLRLKSKKLTDASLNSLAPLVNLTRLTIEDVPVTDAGLAALKTLVKLESLAIKGSRVTDTGINDLKLQRPKLTIDR